MRGVMTSLPHYRAIPATDLVIRPLADITLLYHRPSGQTHMVASPVPEILAALGAHPLDSHAIHARLATRYDLGDPDEARAAIATHLAEMAALGLIRAA